MYAYNNSAVVVKHASMPFRYSQVLAAIGKELFFSVTLRLCGKNYYLFFYLLTHNSNGNIAFM